MTEQTNHQPEPHWLQLTGRKVLVCGAGAFGAAAAHAYLDAGADVAIIDLDVERHRGEFPESTALIQADLSTASVCREAVEEARAALGSIDVLFHTVGINRRVPVLEVEDEQWQQILQINLSSAFWIGQAVGRHMVEQGHGNIVFCSSVSGVLAHPDHSAYAATKGGLNQLLRVMAREWAPHGVNVNAIAPAYADTPLTSAHLAKPGVREGYEAMVPAGRLATAEDMVGPVLFLSSPRSAYVTGQAVLVDGGRTLV